MALTIGLVAGAAGATGTLYGIGKVGQYLWPKKSESLVRLLVAKGEKNSVKTTPTSSLFSEGMREHQYRTISGEDALDSISDVEREVNHYLTVSATSLGLSVAGALFYPPLGLLSLPGLLYVYAPWVQDLYQAIFKEKRLRYVVVDTIFVAGALATGNFVPAAVIATFVTLSKKLLMKAEDHSQEKFLNIFNERPNSLWILKDDIEVEIPIEELAMGDLIVVHAGETIAVDGVIVSGYASIDQRALTGESQPAEKGPGDLVFALTIVLSGQMVITATKAGQETVAAQIGTIFNQTADYRRSIQWQWLEFVEKTTLPTLVTGAVALPFRRFATKLDRWAH